jgi:hypothetical protein
MRKHLKKVDRLPDSAHGSMRYAEIKPLVQTEKRVALLTDHPPDEWIRVSEDRLEPEIQVMYFLAQFALAPTVVTNPFLKPEAILDDLGSGLVICDFMKADTRDQVVERYRLQVVKKVNDYTWLTRYEGRSK